MKKATSVGLLTLLLALTCAIAANADSITIGDDDELHFQATGHDKSDGDQQDWDHKDWNKDWDKGHKDWDHKDWDRDKKDWDNDDKGGGTVLAGSQDLSGSTVSSPEPGTLSMLGLGLLGLVGIARRRLLNS